MSWFFLLFFFQAEDGIRDLYVTGVQTCALPISRRRRRAGHERRQLRRLPARRPAPVPPAGRLPAEGARRLDARCGNPRSEERRVGKECRSRWSAEHQKKKNAGRSKSIKAAAGAS